MTPQPHSLNPFPGLRAFRAEEDYLFFGREEQTMDLLRRLGSSRFVAVVGTSGSGKSSLVRCGLLSELLGGKMLDAGASWEVAVTHPGGNPLGLLTDALLEAELYDRRQEHAREQLLATLSRSHFGLVEAVKQAGLAEGTNFLLVVDQFEEIFRFHEAGQMQQEAANEFVSLLLEAATQRDVPIYIVLTMRSDFIGECGQFEGLAEMVNRGEFLIPRLTREQYKRIIEGPIKVAGGQIAPRLLQRLLNDIGQQQDQLPCLQHALMRTWTVWSQKGDSEALDLDDYQRVGRMAEALSLHADEVYSSLADDRQRELCRGLFQALTVQESENRGIRRPQRLSSLCQILEVQRDELMPVIGAFRQGGVTFLMPSADVELTDQTIIDISHESLMRVWTRLRHWVEDEAQAVGIYRRLSESAALHRHKEAGLYRDPELGIALTWRDAKRPNRAWAERYAPGFADAMAFLEDSRQAAEEDEQAREAARQHELEQAQKLAEVQQQRLEQQRRAARRLRATIATLAVVALVAVVACASALVAHQNAKWHAEMANLQATAARENGERAGRALVATEEALAEVEREKKNAEQSLRKAEAAEAAARRAEEESRRLLYTTDMKLAPFVWKDEEATAEQLSSLLARHDPANANDSTNTESEDLRGFEWYYYRHLIEDAAGVFQGSNGTIVDCAATPEGQLVGLDERGQLRRWDVETHAENETGSLDLAKGRNVQTSALAPDGRTAALAIENQVRLVDTASGDERFTFDSANVGIRRFVFSADGKWLVIFDDRLRWCEAASGKIAATMNHTFPRCEALALSSDGLTCVVAGHGGSGTQFSAFRLDAMTSNVSPLAKDKGYGGTIGAAAVSPEGTLVAIGSKLGGTVILYDATTGNVASYKTAAHASHMAKIAFSPDGSQLATGDVQGTIKLWSEPRKLDVKTSAKATLKGHSGSITKLMFLPDGKRLASASADKTVRLWDTQQAGAAVRSLASSPAAGGHYSPDGLFIASAGDRFLRLWDATSGQRVHQVPAGAGTVSSVACSPDNRVVAVGYGGDKANSYVTLLDIDSGRQLARLPGAVDIAEIPAYEDHGSVTALAFSADGKYLVGGFGSLRYISDSRAVWPLKVWEVSSRRMVRRLEGCLGFCTSIDISCDGGLVAAGGNGGTATVWSTATWTRSQTFENPEQDPAVGYRVVYDVRISPDGATLAMASAGGSIMLWEIASGVRLATLKGHASAVVSLAFAPDGRTLASSGLDETVRLWNVNTRRELMKLDSGAAEQLTARRLAFSPDGSRLFAGGYQRSVFWSSLPPIWDNPDRAAEVLAPLVSSGSDFQLRIRALSDNPRLHEALEKLRSHARLAHHVAEPHSAGTEDNGARLSHPDELRLKAALAAARASAHAARRRWPEAVEEFQRLKEASPDKPADWLRTPGVVRLARALIEQDHLSDAAMLLLGGDKRRIADGAEVGLGVQFAPANGIVSASVVVPGSPADRAGLHKGDVLLKFNGFDAPTEPITWLSWGMFSERPGTEVRLTVRRAESNQPEDVVLTSRAYFADSQEANSLDELTALINKRLAAEPANTALLELGALAAAHRSESEAQVAAATAAIDALAARSSETADGNLKRLYRLRGDGYVALKDWPKAADDYSRGITDDSSADELSNWAMAQAEATFGKTIRTIVPTSEAAGLSWRYTTEQPSSDWANDQFDDASWPEGSAPFGSPSLAVRTVWTSPEIWLRHQFEGEPSAEMKAFFMRLRVDDTAEFFLNSQRIGGRDSWTGDYVFVGLDKVAHETLRAGANTLAVHCRNLQGPGYFDLGLFAARTNASDPRAFFDAKARDEPWLMLALAYRMAGDREAIDKLVERHPQAAGPAGDLFAGDEDWQRAVAIYTVGVERGAVGDGVDVDLVSKRAIAREHLGDWDSAAADWDRTAQDNPDAGRFLAEFAQRLADNGQSVLAAKYYERSRRLLEDDLRTDPGNLAVAETLGKLLLDSNQASDWKVLNPVEATSELGATLTILPDNSILAGGANPVKDRYHVVLTAPADMIVTAVRLEALTHPSLPNHGPGRSELGSFAQVFWTVTASQADGKSPVSFEFDDAWADHQLSTFPIATNGHWNIYGGYGGNCTAIWTLAKPLAIAAGATLSFDMQCQTGTDTGENLGHFRLSLSSDRAAIKKQKAFWTVTTGDLWARLAVAYALHGEMDEATRIAGRLLGEADTVAAKTRLLEALGQAEDLLAAVAKTQAGDLEVDLALARQLADRATARLGNPMSDTDRELLAARDIYTRLHKEYPAPRWSVLKPTKTTSQGGAILTELDDGSVLAGGPNPAKEVYEVEASLDAGAVTALRLEGLPHETMPGEGITRGYTGNVVLTELEAEVASAGSGERWQVVKFDHAWANDELAAYPVTNAIDGVGSTPWGSRGNDTKEVREAVFLFEQPIEQAAGKRLRIRLRHEFGAYPQQFGRFRLSATSDVGVLPALVLRQADRAFRQCLIALGKAEAMQNRPDDSARNFADALEMVRSPSDKREIIESAAPLEGVLEKLAADSPNDADLQAALARYYAERGESTLAEAARQKFIDLYERDLQADQPEKQSVEVAEALAEAITGSLPTRPAEIMRITDPWMRLAAAYACGGDMPRAVSVLKAKGKEEIADKLDESASLDAIIKLLAIDPELERLSEAIARNPEAAAGYSNRGRYFARLGRWRESADDMLYAKKLQPRNHLAWLAAAPPLILAGDDEGYRELCRGMLEQFRGTDVATEADVLCKLCLIRPGMVDLADLPVKRVRDATSEASQAVLRPYFLGCCALASYREGNAREAVAWADKLTDQASIPVATALVLTVRALAEHQLGRNEQARQTLSRASALIPPELRTLGTDAYRGRLPVSEQTISHDWLIPEILRREASAVIDAPAG